MITKIVEGKLSQQCVCIDFAEESKNSVNDTSIIKMLDLEEELEIKDKACKKLVNTCKQTVLHHQNKYNVLKKKFSESKELIKEMKVKKVHSSPQRVSSAK